MKRSKRLLASFLAIVLIVSMMPPIELRADAQLTVNVYVTDKDGEMSDLVDTFTIDVKSAAVNADGSIVDPEQQPYYSVNYTLPLEATSYDTLEENEYLYGFTLALYSPAEGFNASYTGISEEIAAKKGSVVSFGASFNVLPAEEEALTPSSAEIRLKPAYYNKDHVLFTVYDMIEGEQVPITERVRVYENEGGENSFDFELPASPSHEGKTFLGWKDNTLETDFDLCPAGSTYFTYSVPEDDYEGEQEISKDYYAYIVAVYGYDVTTHYVDADGNDVKEALTEVVMENSEYTTEAITIPGYTFVELRDGSDEAAGMVGEAPLDIYYVYELADYTVTAEYLDPDNKALATAETQTITHLSPYETAAKTFDGYELTATPANATGTVDGEDVTVTYQYALKNYTVTTKYVDADGNALTDATTKTVAHKANYTTEAKTIAGYTAGNAPANATGTIDAGDVTVTYTYALNDYTVTTKYVDADGNSLADDVTATVAHKADYTTDAKTFSGYTADAAPANAKGTINASDVTVTYTYALNEYTVTTKYVDADGNELEDADTQTVKHNAKYSTSPKTIDGYTANEAPKNAEGTIDADDVTVTYEYSLTEYSITYNLDGGALDKGVTNPKTYTIKSKNITLKNPTKEGYTFLGWALGSADPVTKAVIKSGSTGNKKFTAKWEEDTSETEEDTEDSDTEDATDADDSETENTETENTETGNTETGNTETGNTETGNTPAETTAANSTATTSEVTEVSTDGTQTLKKGRKYRLGSGKWKVEGDATIYNGDMDIYVPDDIEITFIKQ